MSLGKGLVSQFKEKQHQKQLSEDKITTKKNILINIFLKLNKTEKKFTVPKRRMEHPEKFLLRVQNLLIV